MNLVLPITVGSLAVCFILACIIGQHKRKKEREKETQQFIASATQGEQVQAVVVMSV